MRRFRYHKATNPICMCKRTRKRSDTKRETRRQNLIVTVMRGRVARCVLQVPTTRCKKSTLHNNGQTAKDHADLSSSMGPLLRAHKANQNRTLQHPQSPGIVHRSRTMVHEYNSITNANHISNNSHLNNTINKLKLHKNLKSLPVLIFLSIFTLF